MHVGFNEAFLLPSDNKREIDRKMMACVTHNAHLVQNILNYFDTYRFFFDLVANHSKIEAEGVVYAVFREVEDLQRVKGRVLTRGDQLMCGDLRNLMLENIGNPRVLRLIFSYRNNNSQVERVPEPSKPLEEHVPNEVPSKCYESLSSWYEQHMNRQSLHRSLVLLLAEKEAIVEFDTLIMTLWRETFSKNRKVQIAEMVKIANSILEEAAEQLGVLYQVENVWSKGYRLVIAEEQ